MKADHRNEAVSWFTPSEPGARPVVRVFAFPHAGGSASAFRSWRRYLPPDIELRAAQLPGRELRFSEAPLLDWREIVANAAAAIAADCNLPLVLFGHSMGSLLAFEVARRLRAEYGIHIAALLVSGHGAPHLSSRSPIVRHLEEQQLLERMAELYGGLPAEALADPELVKIMARVLRADITVVETYRYVEAEPLTCPIMALGGKSDPWVDHRELALWEHHTTGPFSSAQLYGDHFYLREAMVERLLLARLVQICESVRKR